MQKPKGLAKAAAMMAMVAALATMLAVNVNPPATHSASNPRGREAADKEIPVPPAPQKGGVGAAQGRGMEVERREAGGARAPSQSSGSER